MSHSDPYAKYNTLWDINIAQMSTGIIVECWDTPLIDFDWHKPAFNEKPLSGGFFVKVALVKSVTRALG